jgi:AhpC/TSA family
VRHRLCFLVIVLAGGILFFGNTGWVAALEVGDRAPAFALPATTVDKISLADYQKNKHVVLFFYIAAFGQA